MIGEAIAGAASGIVAPLANLVDKLFTSDDERNAAKLKLMELQQSGELKTLELQMSAILAEANSKDPWTSRARPTFLYLMYGVIGLCFFGGILGIWWPDSVTVATQNITNLLAAIPSDLWWLFGAGYLGYTGARSFDKRGKR
ncbi:MAG: holin family protein [Rhodospirillum sp.]|nr:holin family protein [Rhodospirillum sp.]MCF8492135.1 holin family protein [Rhodospirillum sp.]MCF8501052.1 holin family protein [Rhodospirillum sp.]